MYTHTQKSIENKKIKFLENVKKIKNIPQLKVADSLKLFIFIKICLHHYEYSRHNRPVSVILDSIPKISR